MSVNKYNMLHDLNYPYFVIIKDTYGLVSDGNPFNLNMLSKS